MPDFPQPFGYAWGAATPDQAQALLDSTQFEGLKHFFSNPSNPTSCRPHYQHDWVNVEHPLSSPNSIRSLPFGLQVPGHLEAAQTTFMRPEAEFRVRASRMLANSTRPTRQPQAASSRPEGLFASGEDPNTHSHLSNCQREMDGLEATFRPNTYADTLLPSDELDPGFYEDIFTASAGLQSLNEPSSLAGANLLRSFSIAGNATHMDIVQPGLPFGSDTGFTQLGFSPLTTMNPSMICPRSLEYTQAESFPHLDLYSHEPPFPFDNAISHPSITSHSATSQEDNSISTNASTAPSVGDFDDKLFANGRGQACPGDLNSVPSQIDSGQGDNLTKGSRRRTTRRPSTVHNNKEPRQVRGRKKSTATLPPQGITNVRRPRLSSEDRKRNHTMSEKVRREKTAQLNEALLKICGLAQSKDTKALKLIHIIDWLHRETAEVDAMAEALAQVGLPTETGVPPPLPALQAAGEATT